MIKKTLAFSNPAYLSLKDNQLVIRLPEAGYCEELSSEIKQPVHRTIPIEDNGYILWTQAQST